MPTWELFSVQTPCQSAPAASEQSKGSHNRFWKGLRRDLLLHLSSIWTPVGLHWAPSGPHWASLEAYLNLFGLHWAPPAPCSSPLCLTWVPFGPDWVPFKPPLAPQGCIWALFEHNFSSIRVPLRSYALNLRPKWGSNLCVCVSVCVLCVVCCVCCVSSYAKLSPLLLSI